MIHPLYALFCGLTIGACDLVPGVSGGTMALILGIYEPLMNSISDLKKGRFTNFKFLFLVLIGIAISLLSFSSFFHTLLADPGKKVYLYSLFLGLVGGSAWIVSKNISQWSVKNFLILFLGIIIAIGVTNLPILKWEFSGIWFYAWLVFCGSMAVFAMLLPGISGSYVLMILGPYPLVIKNLALFSSGLRQGFIDIESLKILFPLACGIVCGACIFSQGISFALKKYKEESLSILVGFMVGATNAIWPFENQFIPYDSTALYALLLVTVGIGSVILLESIASTRYKTST